MLLEYRNEKIRAIGISEAKRKGYKAGERWKKSPRKKKD